MWSRPYQRLIAAFFAEAPDVEPSIVPSYEALMDECAEQFGLMLEAGIRILYCDDDPTPISSRTGKISFRLLVEQVTTTGCLRLYRSRDADHPILGTRHLVHDGRTENFNSVFRGVHDWFGHLASGGPFTWKGETLAYYSHASMFSDAAREALFSETVAQQAWFAVHGDFAPQKCVRYGRQWHTPPLE